MSDTAVAKEDAFVVFYTWDLLVEGVINVDITFLGNHVESWWLKIKDGYAIA
jgi:hypothetical protein